MTLRAQAGANARSVSVDAGREALSVSPGAVAVVSGISIECPANDCGAPSVTNEGRLMLANDAVTGNGSLRSAIVSTTPAGSTTSASLGLIDSTVSGNVGQVGGGVYSHVGAGASGALALSIVNSTVADNVALAQGGGVAVVNTTIGSSATIADSTITANRGSSAGGGLYVGSPVSLSNTILAGNTLRGGSAPDCFELSGMLAADGPAGHNVVGVGSGCEQLLDGVDGDQVGSGAAPLDARLAPLAPNGGATETALPLAGSPAIARGSVAACQAPPAVGLDERGSARSAPARGACDVGAYDTGGTSVTPRALAAAGRSVSITVTGSGFVAGATTLSSSSPAIAFSAVKVRSPTTLTAKESVASAGVVPGAYDLTVAEPGVASTCAGCLIESVPTIGSISPATIAQRARKVVLAVAGGGFAKGIEVSFSGPSAGVAGTAKLLGPTSLSVRATVAATAAPGAYTLTLTNRDGGTTSCERCLTVTPPGGA